MKNKKATRRQPKTNSTRTRDNAVGSQRKRLFTMKPIDLEAVYCLLDKNGRRSIDELDEFLSSYRLYSGDLPVSIHISDGLYQRINKALTSRWDRAGTGFRRSGVLILPYPNLPAQKAKNARRSAGQFH